MKREVEFKINNKKIMKKLEEIALKKYPTNSNQYDSQNIYMDGRFFIPVNSERPFGLPKEPLPYNHRKIKCTYCENTIIVPIGYNHCPKCGHTVYVDKNTASLK